MSRSASRVPPWAAWTAVLALLAPAAAGCVGPGRSGGADRSGRTAGDGATRTPDGLAGVGDPLFPWAGNGGYDVTRYVLELAYEPDEARLSGTATVVARAGRDLPVFHLDLRGLTVAEVTVDGERARWERDGQELIVRPRTAPRKGAEFRARVRYSGTPATVTDADGSEEGWLRTASGVYALGEPDGTATWFPGSHHPSDKAAYEVTVTVPEGLRAVSNGEPTRTVTRDGRTAFTWRTAEPVASHAATLAIGDFTVRRFDAAGVPALVALAPGQEAAGKELEERLPEVLRWAREWFGPYPFASSGAIVAGPHDAGYALETHSRPFFPGGPGTGLLVHELAHQWYGDSVTPRTWRDIWLAEGFATYAEWLWQEEHGGPSAEETFAGLLADGATEYPDLWSFPPARPPDAGRLFASGPVYQRAAMVLHRVRQTVGDEGFRRLLRGWSAAHRHGNASTADFTAHAERLFPDADLRPVWERWLYGEGKPKDS